MNSIAYIPGKVKGNLYPYSFRSLCASRDTESPEQLFNRLTSQASILERLRSRPNQHGRTGRKTFTAAAVESARVRFAARTRTPAHIREKALDLLLFLLKRAYHKAGRIQNARNDIWWIDRGDLTVTQVGLARALGWSRQNVRSVILFLQDQGELKVYSTPRGSVISIVKYESYYQKQPNAIITTCKVTNRISPPPTTPLNNNNYIKQDHVAIQSSKTSEDIINIKSNRVGQVFRRKISAAITPFPKTAHARTETLHRLFNGGGIRETTSGKTRAYLIDASKGRIPVALAIKLLTDPKFTPTDNAWQQARQEENQARAEKSRPNAIIDALVDDMLEKSREHHQGIGIALGDRRW